MALFGLKSLAAGALLVASSAIGAQAPAKPACDVVDAPKGNTAKATLFLNQAREAQSPAAAATALKTVVKLVEGPDKSDDPVARAYTLGSALALWGSQPDVGLMPKRGMLGFTGSPDAKIDLVGSVDSLFTIVEKAKPNCTDFTTYWRAGQKFYLDIVNGAINSLNASKLDSAEYYATQASRLYAASPYGAMILGNVASQRGANDKALQFWSAAATAAAKDTAYRDVQRQMLANMGTVYMNAANAGTGAAKADAARRASETYSALLMVPGTRGSYLTVGRQNLQQSYLMLGDTASFVKSYQEMLGNTAAYDYLDLLNTAVNAARASRTADAARLFEGTLAQNPYNRDALYNLAFTYLALEQNDRVAPMVSRLVAVDPGNPENYNLAARAYLALAKAAEKAKRTPMAAAYNDSTVQWYNKGNVLPIEVSFTEFSPSDKQVVISGNITDRRDKADVSAVSARPTRGKVAAKPAAKAYPAKVISLRFEALDKNGAVLSSGVATTAPLTPGKSAPFTVTIPAANPAAYRYTIID